MPVKLRHTWGLVVAGLLAGGAHLGAGESAPLRTEATEIQPTQASPEETQQQRRARGERGANNNNSSDSGRWLERLGRFRALDKHERDHESVRGAFREIVQEPHLATVRVLCDDKAAALGAIVDAEGYILTKASELRGKLSVKLSDKRLFDAELVGLDRKTDLAMLKIDADNLPVLAWRDAEDVPSVGSLLASAGQETLPVAIGVVSVQPRRISAPSGVLGIVLGDGDGPPVVYEVMDNSGAKKAGLLKEDIVLALNGEAMRSREHLVETVRQFQPGDKLMLEVKRGDQQFDVQATLGERPSSPDSERKDFQNMLGGPLSERRTGFPLALQHDTVLTPLDCGGPLVDLDGRCVGINIARAGRVNSYALPVSVVLPLLNEFKAGKYAPAPTGDKRKLELTKRWEALKETESTLVGKLSELLETIGRLQEASEDNREEQLAKAEAERQATEAELGKVKAEIEALENQKTSVEK